jgi:hypothetical protein
VKTKTKQHKMIFFSFFICLPAFRRDWRTAFTPEGHKRGNANQRAQDIRLRLVFMVQPISVASAGTAYNRRLAGGATAVIFLLLKFYYRKANKIIACRANTRADDCFVDNLAGHQPWPKTNCMQRQ